MAAGHHRRRHLGPGIHPQQPDEQQALGAAFRDGSRKRRVAGAGFDSQCAEYAKGVRRLRGPLVYVWSVVRVLARFVPLYATLDHALALEQRSFGLLFGTEDQREGMSAFLAKPKRKPGFQGK